MQLTTQRLLLKPFVQDNLDFLIRLYSNPTVMQSLGGVRTTEVAQIKAEGFCKHWDEHGFGDWVMYLPDNSPIGICGIRMEADTMQPEIGFILDYPYWQKGYADRYRVWI